MFLRALELYDHREKTGTVVTASFTGKVNSCSLQFLF